MKKLSLTQQFSIIGLVIMILGLFGIGWWVGEQIKEGAIRETGVITALYMDSFVSPELQELGQGTSLMPEHIAALSTLKDKTVLGQRIVSLKIWGVDGRVLYSTTPSLIGQVFPVVDDLALSLQGEVTAEISTLNLEENRVEKIGRASCRERV